MSDCECVPYLSAGRFWTGGISAEIYKDLECIERFLNTSDKIKCCRMFQARVLIRNSIVVANYIAVKEITGLYKFLFKPRVVIL